MSYKPYEEFEDGPLRDQILLTQNRKIFADLFVKFGASKCALPPTFAKYRDAIANFHVRNDDIWVATYPKAGTTWCQEMTWLIANDLDYEGAKKFLFERTPFFEVTAVKPDIDAANNNDQAFEEGKCHPNSIRNIEQLTSPRVIKTHLTYELLPKEIVSGEKKSKIIYVTREPKDICVSFYHHKVIFEGYLGTLDDFVEEFVEGYCFFGPYWSHVAEFWKIRNEPNVLFIKYEEMKQDLSAVVDKVSMFLNKKITEEEKVKLVDHLSFEKMKNNPFVNMDDFAKQMTHNHGKELKTNFIRKGKVGSWKEELSPKSIKLLNEWNSKHFIDGLYPKVN